jgi:hypothetical protein
MSSFQYPGTGEGNEKLLGEESKQMLQARIIGQDPSTNLTGSFQAMTPMTNLAK